MTKSEIPILMGVEAIDPWIKRNTLIDYLKGDSVDGKLIRFESFVDVDLHAEEAGMTKEEFLEQVRDRVGYIGAGVLRLVESEFDDGYNIVIEDASESTDN